MHGETMLSLQDLPDSGLSSDSFLLLFFCSAMVYFGTFLHRLPH